MRPDAITPRERQILEGLAAGMTQPEVADVLGISPHTVRTHVGRILDKLGAKTAAQAVAIWLHEESA